MISECCTKEKPLLRRAQSGDPDAIELFLAGYVPLLRALAMAGGGSQLADLEEVMLFRLTPDGQSLVEKHDVLKIRVGEAPDPALRGDDVVVVNRNTARATLRDSLFRDILDTINPFSATYRNAVTP